MTPPYPIKTLLISLITILVLILTLYIAINLLQQNTQENIYNNNSSFGVIEIIDGDTFRMPNGETIRLLCVDTPEKGAEGYNEATNFLSTRLLDSEPELIGNKTDAYNRSLRWVYVDDILINKEIIDLGYGTLFEYENEDCERAK